MKEKKLYNNSLCTKLFKVMLISRFFMGQHYPLLDKLSIVSRQNLATKKSRGDNPPRLIFTRLFQHLLDEDMEFRCRSHQALLLKPDAVRVLLPTVPHYVFLR
jgi:hypothetical protein